jgi:Protein of unknown function (DUF2971)
MKSLHEYLEHLTTIPYFYRRLDIKRRIPALSRFLYKYKSIDRNDDVSVDRMRDLLVRSRLWLSSPDDFNDPFDMSVSMVAKGTAKERRERFINIMKTNGIKYKERMQQVKTYMHEPEGALIKRLQDVYNDQAQRIGVFSFAGDPKNILMWSHYGKDHTGVCIQFERAHDIPIFCGALSVEYTEKYPEVNWLKEFQESLGKIILLKHKGWEYEDEHRIIRPNQARTYLKFKPESIVRIIIGCRASEETINAIKDLLEERKNAKLPSIQILFTKQHASKYHLSIFS